MPSQEQTESNGNGNGNGNGMHRARVAHERASETAPHERANGTVSVLRDGSPPRPGGPNGGAAGDPPPPRRAVRVAHSSVEASTHRRGAWVYVKHALMHPWHVVVLAGATVFGVANWSLFVLLVVFAGAELLLLGIVLHLRVFRRYVDERLDQIDRGQGGRAALDAALADGRRAPARAARASRRSSIASATRTRPHGTAAQIAVDECMRLLASYVRLAIAYNVSRECLASVDRQGPGRRDANARGRTLLGEPPHARAGPAAAPHRPQARGPLGSLARVARGDRAPARDDRRARTAHARTDRRAGRSEQRHDGARPRRRAARRQSGHDRGARRVPRRRRGHRAARARRWGAPRACSNCRSR